MKNIYPFLFIALFLSACSNYLLRKGTENVKSITNIPLRPGTSQVDLFFKDDLPAKPFYKVQMIEAVGYNNASYDELLKKLTANARQAGFDAVLVLDKVQEVKYEDLLELNTNTTDWALFTNRQVANSYQKISGIGIKYKENINYLDSIPKQASIDWWNGHEWQNHIVNFDYYGNVTNTDSTAQWYNREIAAFDIAGHLKSRVSGWEYLNTAELQPLSFRYKQFDFTLINARYDFTSTSQVRIVNYKFSDLFSDQTKRYQLISVMETEERVKEKNLSRKNKTVWIERYEYDGNRCLGFYRLNGIQSKPDTVLKATFSFYSNKDLPEALVKK